MLLAAVCVVAGLVVELAGSAAGRPTPAFASSRPNIVVVLTDDQDRLLGGADHMPKLRSLVVEQGVQFKFGFANTPVCCPSRSSLLTGRFVHNHGAVNNTLQGDCTSRQWQQTIETDALAVHMQAAGYRSLYAGKYLNNYGAAAAGGVSYIPPGWSEWFGLVGNSRYYNLTISDNGTEARHYNNYNNDYLTDLLARRAVEFIESHHRNYSDQPFLLWVGTPAAHAPFTPAPQYFNTAAGQKAPRTPSYNAAGLKDKHNTVRFVPEMTTKQMDQSDEIYRHRLGALLSVDDLVEALFDALDATNQTNNTFVIFTSDHGFHLGQFGMGFDKRQLYETDIRVPYFVRGPGVPRNQTLTQPISHVDLAPTILDIATGSVPLNWDGRSYKSLLQGNASSVPWRADVLIQYFGEGGASESCGSGNAIYVDNVTALAVDPYIDAPCDGWNNTYTCVRTVLAGRDDIFCEFTCFDDGHNEVPCGEGEAEGYGEYYDLTTDPWQLNNTAKSLTEGQLAYLKERINDMKRCVGQAGCQHTAASHSDNGNSSWRTARGG